MIVRRGTYGVDAPYVPLLMLAAAAPLVLGALSRGLAGDVGGMLGMGSSGVVFLFGAASYLYTTRVGKFRAWDGLLEDLRLEGSERLLDLGCGRGAVLLMAAQRLPRGKAIGIDLWQAQDQSGNAAAATQRNAEREGVASRVELETGDMQRLPFADASFEVVVSSLALHNIPDATGRAEAVREAARVLRPGGRMVLADFRCTKEYASTLVEARLADVSRRRLGPGFWYGGPWAATHVVMGRKPAT
jgi:arsenite methyltransferase